ncbi:hypothetical protein AXF42_Ash018150 [Apostasia shenzhenica]|uniref:Protein GPR107 n=1 Tax=Apostasia shenzhenica TaxID=1088818 RepID=A0A2I0AF16_9ASPA|nr:hypothetical protein AXF42_Ash018150 [Apostasia shenzhenica]
MAALLPPLRHHHHSLLRLLLLIIFLPNLAISEIKKTYIQFDSRAIILFEQFGFSPSGAASVSISHATLRPHPPNLNPSSLGFILVPNTFFPFIANESFFAEAEHQSFCPLSSRFVFTLLTFQNLDARTSSGNGSVTIAASDEYTLLFVNCAQNGVEVTMDVRTEMYNLEGGGVRDYLPAGKAQLPSIYFGFFLAYAAFLAAWIKVCVRQRPTLETIHLVMAALLLFKGLKMVCASEDLWFVKRTGTAHGWDVAFYVFGFFKGILLFTVIVLIGTGWSFLKPYLQEREKNVLMIVIPLQVVENIASAVIGETGPAEKDWVFWNKIFLIVDIICCCAVFFPIIWSIRNLREASKTDGKAARNLQKLTLFRQFYIVVVGYLYFTRIFGSALEAIINYQHQWVVTVAVELVSLGFYLFVFYNFQPVERNPYLYVGDEEEEAAAAALEMEDGYEL